MTTKLHRALTLALLPALSLTNIAVSQETPAADRPAPVPAVFHPSRIVTGENSYLVLFQGTEIGDLTLTVSEDGGVVTTGVVVDVFVQGTSVYQTAESRFRTDLTMVSMTSRMDMMGMQMGSDITYDNGHVTGYSQAPNQMEMGAIDTVQIDTTLAAGVMGTGALPALMLTLDLTEGAAYSVRAFEPATNSVRDVVFRVAEAGQTTVADGTFDTWTVVMEGTSANMTYYVRRSDRKVLKMVPVGQPVEFVLAGPPTE